MAEPKVTTSDRLWSQECEAVDPGLVEEVPDYEFSNGRRFTQ
jgi:hypothetical protein